MYGLQHGALAHAIKGSKITSVKSFKRENQRSNLYKKRETRNAYKLRKRTTTTVYQIPGLGQVQTFAAGLNDLMVPNLLPFSGSPQIAPFFKDLCCLVVSFVCYVVCTLIVC